MDNSAKKNINRNDDFPVKIEHDVEIVEHVNNKMKEVDVKENLPMNDIQIKKVQSPDMDINKRDCSLMDDVSSSDSDTTSSDSSSSSSSDSESLDSAGNGLSITFKKLPVKRCLPSTSKTSAVGISKDTETLKRAGIKKRRGLFDAIPVSASVIMLPMSNRRFAQMWEEVSKTISDPSAQPSTSNMKEDEGISESSSNMSNQRINSNRPSTSIICKEKYSHAVVVPDNIGVFMLLESVENRVGALCNDKEPLQHFEDVTDTKNGILVKCTTFKSFVTSKTGNFMIHQSETPKVESYPDIAPMPCISCTCCVEGFILKWEMPPETPTYSYAKPVYYDIFWCSGNAKKLTEECIWHYFASVKAEDQPMQSLLEERYFEDHVYNFAVRSRDMYNRCGMCSDPLKVIRIVVH